MGTAPTAGVPLSVAWDKQVHRWVRREEVGDSPHRKPGTGEGSKGAEGTCRAGGRKTPSLASPVAPMAPHATFVKPAFRLRRTQLPLPSQPRRKGGASSAKRSEGKALCGSAAPSPASLTSPSQIILPTQQMRRPRLHEAHLPACQWQSAENRAWIPSQDSVNVTYTCSKAQTPLSSLEPS